MATRQQRAIRSALATERRIRQVEDEVVRSIVASLKDARAETLDRLAFASREWQAAQARATLAEIDRQLILWGEQTTRTLSAAYLDADRLGAEGMLRALRSAGVVEVGAAPTIASSQVIASQQTLPWLITSVSQQTTREVAVILRRAILAQLSPTDVMRALGPVVGPTASGPFRNASLRAEAIARTELGRLGQQASYGTLNDYATRFDRNMAKQWVTWVDGRTRPAHMAANGQERFPVTLPFTVWGEQLLYPKDPRGSARNVVNCRCVLVPSKPGW